MLISGQAGTGKSFVVSHILKSLRSKGLKVLVICTSGISCSVYEESVRSRTVHSQYALQTADMPSEMVIERATSTLHCMEELRKADTIVWDEIGMSSQRVFELVNTIHHKLDPENREDGEITSWKPFGGKQMILVGEFLQLRPVPNTFDEGKMMYESELFARVHTSF